MGTIHHWVLAFCYDSSSKKVLDFFICSLPNLDVNIAWTFHVGWGDFHILIYLNLDSGDIDLVSWFELFSENITKLMKKFLFVFLTFFFNFDTLHLL